MLFIKKEIAILTDTQENLFTKQESLILIIQIYFISLNLVIR